MQLFNVYGSIGLKDNGFNSGIDEATNKGNSFASKAGGAIVKFGQVAAAGLGAAAAAISAVSIAALKSGADLEQSVGGIETLFKGSAEAVIKNAEKAYMTAGIDANSYMQQVTSFSASLLGSLGGDTEKAAAAADMAIIDMADNANKMGTAVESVQLAYQGFAKGNYTMLDNLKLGYGGTKTEMERLLVEAEKITGIKYDITNLNDVYSAVHVIQEELGITGTTAKEGMETLSGAFATAKAALGNFLSGASDVQPFVDTVINLANVLSDRLTELLPRLVAGFSGILQGLVPAITPLVQQLLPPLIEGAVALIQALLAELPNLVNVIVEALPLVIAGILAILPLLADAGMQMITALLQGISEMLPTLIPTALDAILAFVDAILKNAPKLLEAGLELIIQLGEGIINAIPTLIEALPKIITQIVDFIMNARSKIMEAGLKLLVALIKNLPAIINGIVEAIPKIIAGLVKALTEGAPLIVEVGVTLLTALIKNLPAIIVAVVTAIPKIVKGIVEAFADKKTDVTKSGYELFVSFIKDLPNIITKILSAVGEIVIGIVGKFQSFKQQIVDVGKNIVSGIGEGITKGANAVVEQVKNFAKSLLTAAKNALNIKSPSRDFEDEFGVRIPEGTALGISKGASKAEKAAAKMAKDTLASAKLWIQDYKQSTDYLASEEVKMWEYLGSRYAQGSKERVEIDKQRIAAQKQLGAEQEKIIDNIMKLEDDYQKKLDDRTNAIFNAFGLFDELSEKENKREKELEDATKKHNDLVKSIHDLNVELAKTDSFDKQIEIMNKITTQQDLLAKSSQDLAKAKESALKTEGQVLLENLEKQLVVMREWAADIQSLSKRGIDEGLLKYLKEMGPKAYSDIDALNNMTAEQLTQYSEKWKEKTKIARDQAVAETKGLRTDVDSQIKGLVKDLESTIPNESKAIGSSFVQGIISGIRAGAQELRTTAQELAKELTAIGATGNSSGINGKKATTAANQATTQRAATNTLTVSINNSNSISNNMDVASVSRKLANQTVDTLRSRGVFV